MYRLVIADYAATARDYKEEYPTYDKALNAALDYFKQFKDVFDFKIVSIQLVADDDSRHT